jgi:peroxiredoxin
MRADIIPGAVFPDYELPDHTGTPCRLSALQGSDPAALVLARGGFCPKEHVQHVWMAGMAPEVTVGYCRFITLSTDSVLASKEWRQRLGAHWSFLSDEARVVQQDLEIREYTDPQHDPMIPHTILLEPGLVIHKIYMGYWYWGRPTPEDIRQDFRVLTRKCRPDWDPCAPGLKDKWESESRKQSG